MVTKVSNGFYVLGKQSESAMLSINDREDHPQTIYPTSSSTSRTNKTQWARWFASGLYTDIDREPQVLLDLVRYNNLQVPLLNTNVDFVIGQGIGIFRRVIDGGRARLEPFAYLPAEEWMKRNEV